MVIYNAGGEGDHTYAFVAYAVENTIKFCAVDVNTEQIVYGPQFVDYGRSPVLALFSGVVSCVYLKSTGPGGWGLSVASRSAASAPTGGLGTARPVTGDTITVGAATDPFAFCAAHDGTDWYVAAWHTTWSQGRINKFTDNTISTPTATTATFTATAVDDLYYDSNTSRLLIAYMNSGQKLAEVDTSTLSLGTAVSCPSNTNLALFGEDPYDDTVTIVYLNISDSVQVCTLDGTTLTTYGVCTGARLRSRPGVYDGRSYCLMAGAELGDGSFYNHAQLTCLYQRESGNNYSGIAPVSVFLVDRPFGSRTFIQAPPLLFDTVTSKFVSVVGLMSSEVATSHFGSSVNVNDPGEEHYVVFAEVNKKPAITQFGELSYASGGVLRSWDGLALVTTHIGANPYLLDVTSGLSGTGHNFRLYYEAIDHKGVRHRSAVSNADERGSSDGSAGSIKGPGPIVWDFYSAFTGSIGSFPPVYGVVAYDQGGTSNYYNAYHVGFANITSPGTSPDFDYTSTRVADDVFLYTTGNELPSNTPPSSSFVLAAKERLFLVPSEDKNQLWYSKLYAPGIAAEFNSVLRLLVDREGGDITGLASVDDKIIIFKENRVLYTYGEGYDDTGGGSNFAPPQLISGEVGCINPRSIVTGSFGVMFESNKGIWQIDRGMQFTYIGGAVEDEHSSSINTAINVETRREVQFFQNNGNVLVFNYLFGLWTRFTNVNADCAGLYNNTLWKADADDIRDESLTNYANDSNQHIQMKVGTPWLRLNKINGFQRIRRAMLLLTGVEASNNTKIEVYYNYSDSSPDTISWSRTELSGFDGGSAFQLEVHIPQQKCTAIKLVFSDDSDGATARDGYEVQGLTLEYGIKANLGKEVPAARRK